MKLRIRGNTLRFRLGQSEVADLRTTGAVASRVVFGPTPESELHYVVECLDAAAPAVRYEPGSIRVALTAELTNALEHSEEEGISFEADTGTGTPLRVSIERDFTCLKPREGESEADSFANPAAGETC